MVPNSVAVHLPAILTVC